MFPLADRRAIRVFPTGNGVGFSDDFCPAVISAWDFSPFAASGGKGRIVAWYTAKMCPCARDVAEPSPRCFIATRALTGDQNTFARCCLKDRRRVKYLNGSRFSIRMLEAFPAMERQ